MNAPLTRKLPDDTGKLVTYLNQTEASKVTGIHQGVISAWSLAGCVRKLDQKVGRGVHVALVDIIRISLMTPEELKAAGIQKTPLKYRLASKKWVQDRQDLTRDEAEHHMEEWDDYDIDQLIFMEEHDWPVELMARKLGRTYEAITTRLEMLREQGDLTRKIKCGTWTIDDALELLTPEEREEVTR